MATRSELFSKMGLNKQIVEPILNLAYKKEEEQIWREDLFSSPHGEHWHTSFHASSFPGDNEKACGRAALYTLMNIPSQDPIDRNGRAIMEAGKAIEENIVWRLHRTGLLLTDPPDEEFQMGYADEEHWLTCAPDAIINMPKENRPHPIEIKSKDHKVVEEMRMGMRSFDQAHRIQLQTQIAFTVENSENLWPELKKCLDGSILYVSRDRPGTTHEFRFRYNPSFMKKGREKLAEWRNSYKDAKLPERPKSWRWTEQPCKYCKFKRVCKADYKEKIVDLEKSNGIEFAKEVRGNYDYKKTREKVLDRWEG